MVRTTIKSLKKMTQHLIQEDADKHFEKIPKFNTDDQVYARNHSSGKPSKTATVLSPTGSLSYHEQTKDENHRAKKNESQKKTTREETETVEAIPEENAAIVTTSREERKATSQSADTTNVEQRGSSTQERRPP
ncbi:hypothetical protein T05_12532 [Trichinella murrelli]|uniref:Uncharacterized protein n=1 Tax=Trichinella murrelli TaxID=144512 RepID=A0A0V0TB38_9BILA|nr:hypothetical protein T05_12532 [Trichinella murrelli]